MFCLTEYLFEVGVVKKSVAYQLDKIRAFRGRIFLPLQKMVYSAVEGIHTVPLYRIPFKGAICYTETTMGFLSFSRDIGIDVGTSRTRIYVPYRGIVFDEPSMLACDADRNNQLICVGDCANEMVGRTPANIEVCSVVSRGVVQDEKIAERYLETSLRQSRGMLRVLRHDMLIGIPTDATSMEQRAVIQTCKRSGARNVFVEQNAILAAFGIGTHKDELRGRMVADIGAGLTETAVISLGGMSSHNTLKVGGNDMDRSIVGHVRARYQLSISEDTARTVKEKIGSVMIKDNPKELKVKGSDSRTKLPRVIRISSNDIAEAVRGEAEKIIAAIAGVFRNTPPELTSDIIDRGVVLTGGVSKLDGLDAAIEKYINAPVHLADNPEHAVIRGIGRSIQTGHFGFHKRALLSK